MKRSKFSDEQILAIVKEGEAGQKVADLSRTYGITEQTYYRWKAKYGGMELSEMQRTETGRGREPPTETDRGRANARHSGAQGGRRKKVVGPIARREAVGWLQTRGTSLRRACRVIGLSTATWRYQRRTNATNMAVLARLRHTRRSVPVLAIAVCTSCSSETDSS